jgi:taurine dioxygenase
MTDLLPRSKRLSVTPLAGSLGGQVNGVDLRKPLDDETMELLRAAFLKYCVLVYPGQERLTVEEHVAFAERWGQVHYMPTLSSRLDQHPAIVEVDYHGRQPTTDMWHSDMTMEECPPMASLLLARVVPAGGDTMFANQYLAYDMLSDGMKAMLADLKAVHTGTRFGKVTNLDPEKLPTSAHPVVRTHPQTGRKALYVNEFFTIQFDGMTTDESLPLLRWLWAHCSQPNITFRHRWSVGDMVQWDNRCVQHYAIADYGSAQRTMHRATVLGDRPR